MKVATWNINGVGGRIEHLVRWSSIAQPDVICLQETKSIDSRFPRAKAVQAGYKHIEVYGEKSYNGVAILSKFPLTDIHFGFPQDDGSARDV